MSTSLVTLSAQVAQDLAPAKRKKRQHKQGLTIPMLNFIDQYLQTGNATKSAIAAGYSETSAHTTGSRLLRNSLVKTAIEEAKLRQRSGHGVSPAWVIGKLKGVADSTGARSADVIAASVAIGKHLNMFTDRKEVDAKITITVERVGG